MPVALAELRFGSFLLQQQEWELAEAHLPRAFEQLSLNQEAAPASVVLAPPGGGKSTLLRHYHLNQAQHLADSDRLVFYAQLRDYRPEKLPEGNGNSALPALGWLEAG